MNNHKGLIGAAITATGSVVSWLPVINEVVQIVAGLVAIVVGLVTLRHYSKKENQRHS